MAKRRNAAASKKARTSGRQAAKPKNYEEQEPVDEEVSGGESDVESPSPAKTKAGPKSSKKPVVPASSDSEHENGNQEDNEEEEEEVETSSNAKKSPAKGKAKAKPGPKSAKKTAPLVSSDNEVEILDDEDDEDAPVANSNAKKSPAKGKAKPKAGPKSSKKPSASAESDNEADEDEDQVDDTEVAAPTKKAPAKAKGRGRPKGKGRKKAATKRGGSNSQSASTSKKAKKAEPEPEGSDDDDDDEKEFEVEKIVDMKFVRNGKREFLIKWKGWGSGSNTWEPEEHLQCTELLEAFTSKLDHLKEQTHEIGLRVERHQTQRYTDANRNPGVRTSRRFTSKPRTMYHGLDE